MKSTSHVPSNRVKRKKVAMRLKIITAAVQLFQHHGYADTTMEQIAQKADIAKGTLYAYFPIKEAIIVAYIQSTFQAQNQNRIEHLRQLPDTSARMRYLFKDLTAGVQRQKDVFETYMLYRVRCMLSFHQDDNLKSGLSVLGEEIILLGQQQGEIRTDLPKMLLEDLFEFAIIEVIKQFYQSPQTFNSQEAIDQAVNLFIHATHPHQ